MSNTGGKLIACGYLRKKSPKGLVGLSLWQRRFFCLYENVMTYSKDKNDVSQNQASGAIPVREMVSVERVRKDPCRFEIMISGRIFSLLADSPAEVTDWVDALSKQIILVKTRLQSHRSNSDPDLEKPVKYWKDAKGVLDDLNSPNRPSVQPFSQSNAFTKIDLSTLASLSSSTMRSAKSGVKITIVPPSNDELDAMALHSTESNDDSVVGDIDDPAGSERRFNLDDLKVEKILGQGVFGDLCLVLDKKSAEYYMMQRMKVTSPTATMALDAMRKMSSLNNPYIMQCLDYEITSDQAWAIYEYVQGPNLLQHLRTQRRFPEEIARLFLAEVAYAVNYVHKKGSIFRNMDPEHIALDITGHVVITDFRIALAAADNHQPCRNAEYRTPEYISGQGECPESDWWRLGVLTYELLVGFPPFRDKDQAELDHKIQSCILRFPPFVSGHAADFMHKLMQVDIDQRLGRGRTGFSNLQSHAFFTDTNWNLVESRNQPIPGHVLEFVQQSITKVQ